MEKAKLKELGVPDEALDAVFDAITADAVAGIEAAVKAEKEKNESELLKQKERADAAEGKLADMTGERDTLSGRISDMERGHAREKLFSDYSFSSELAREAAMSKFAKEVTEFADGEFTGGRQWLDDLKKNEPSAFSADVPPPKLMTGSGKDAGGMSDAEIDALMGIK